MKDGTSSARLFFDQLRSLPDPASFLASLPDETADHYPFFEEEWLDFKGAPGSDDNAKEIWSKALSGFANTTDGLIVWGVDARKTKPREIDAASGLRLIPDPQAFESRLRDWIRDATNPPVMNVDYFSCPTPEGGGFVVCLIPESRHKPHRAESAKKHYYFRAGDDFLPAEPGLLRMLFYPQRSCQLEFAVEAAFEITGAASPFHKPTTAGRVSASIKLGGSMTAREVYIKVSSLPHEALTIWRGTDWEAKHLGDKTAFRCLRPIHPGEEIELLRNCEIKASPAVIVEGRDYVMKVNQFDIQFDIYIADQQSQTKRFRLPQFETPLRSLPCEVPLVELAE